MTLSEKLDSLISDLNLIADPQERLSVVVSQAASLCLPDAQKIDDNRVAGCVSRVWLVGNYEGGRCSYRCDADSPLVKGLVALLCELYSDRTPEEVSMVEPEIWAKCGFDRLLSPTRLNGLNAVRARIRDLAGKMHASSSAGP